MTRGHRIPVTIFGSARPLPGDPGYELAYHLGEQLSAKGFAVCNGGYEGTMEAAARGAWNGAPHASQDNPRTIGVTCTLFAGRPANRWIDQEITTTSLFDRITTLLFLGRAYVVLPGGTGTLLELAAAWEFIHKGFIEPRPVVLLGDFWDGVLASVRKEPSTPGARDPFRAIHAAESPTTCVHILCDIFGRNALGQ